MVKSDASISLLLSKASRRPPGLKSASDGRIAINSTYNFLSFALGGYLGFNHDIIETETRD
jgi:hypothetical protein